MYFAFPVDGRPVTYHVAFGFEPGLTHGQGVVTAFAGDRAVSTGVVGADRVAAAADRSYLRVFGPLRGDAPGLPGLCVFAEDAPTRRLAHLEHARWCADRRLAGWRHGASRDEAWRRHPDLVAFDDPRLTDREIAKDVRQIRTLLAAAVRPGPGGASAPVVLGVVGSADASAGIGLADALATLDAAPCRPVVVLAAMAGGGEAGTVDALLAALRAGDRPFRLLIPSRDPAAAPSRLSALARDASVLQLAGAGDGWVDSDRHERWIEDHIGRRATIVLRSAP